MTLLFAIEALAVYHTILTATLISLNVPCIVSSEGKALARNAGTPVL